MVEGGRETERLSADAPALASERSTPVSLAFQVLGATAGLVALITFVGGAMLWVRFDQLDLPADRAVAMLPRELLVVVGAHSLLGPLLVAAAAAGLVVLLQPLDRSGHIRRRFWVFFLPLLLAVTFVTLVVQAWGMDTGLAAIAVLAALLAIGAIVGTAWRGSRARYIAWTVFGACAFFGAVLAVIRTIDNPRMEPVGVLTKDDAQGLAGFFVGETDDRLYLVPVPGNDDPGHPLADARADMLLVVPRDRVERISMREPVGIGTDDPGRDQARTLLFDLISREEQIEGTATVTSLDPERDFAPLVHLHSGEEWYPMSARGFIDNSVLSWSNKPGCPAEIIATGRSVPGDKRFGVTDPKSLGASATTYRRAPDAPDCDPDTAHPVSFLATELTRPYSTTARPPRLPLPQGFYLDLANGQRRGHRDAHKEGPQTFLRDVPAYVQRDEERIGRRTGIRLTYWLFYGFSEPPGPRGFTRLVSHEGDWERVSVLLRRGREPDTYVPQSARFHFHNEYRDVPWYAVKRASGTGRRPTPPTHPVVYSARGSHASFWRAGEFESPFETGGRRHFSVDDVAIACPDCPQWRTWELVRGVRDEPWYGFGGAWGKVGSSGDTTGPLGPSTFKP